MTFTSEERRLFFLYRCDSASETAAVVTDALADVTDPDERAAAEGLLEKLIALNGAAFDYIDMGDFYD